MGRSGFQFLVCEPCVLALTPFASSLSISRVTPSLTLCGYCKISATCTSQIMRLVLSKDAILAIEARLSACSASGCCHWIDNANGDYGIYTDYDELSEVLELTANEGSLGTPVFSALVESILVLGGIDLIEFPSVICRNCKRALSSWDDVVVQDSRISILEIPQLPEDVLSLTIKSQQAKIELYRPDCSPYLIHLTRPGMITTHISNLTGAKKLREGSAASILWLILKMRLLKASRGKGMHAPAVCFTDKSLPALKETLVGHESEIRREVDVLKWYPYGLMFSKEYMFQLGVRPVISAEDLPSGVDPAMFVRFDTNVNWTHEREWRVARDVSFDPAQAILLLPDFNTIRTFSDRMKAANISVRGFLPLLDICTWV